jgi:hypothetical protein
MGYCSWEGRTAEEDWGVVAACKSYLIYSPDGSAKSGSHPLGQDQCWTYLDDSRDYQPSVGQNSQPLQQGSHHGGQQWRRGGACGIPRIAIWIWHRYWRKRQDSSSVRHLTVVEFLLKYRFCGLYSLRPSHGRLSMRNVADPLKGQEAVRSTPGPMAHSPEDLELLMKAYLYSEPWRADPAVHKLPWTPIPIQETERRFCFAITYGDELVRDMSGDM